MSYHDLTAARLQAARDRRDAPAVAGFEPDAAVADEPGEASHPTEGMNVEQVLEYVDRYPGQAQSVLDIELARDQPRKTVVDALAEPEDNDDD